MDCARKCCCFSIEFTIAYSASMMEKRTRLSEYRMKLELVNHIFEARLRWLGVVLQYPCTLVVSLLSFATIKRIMYH